MTQYYDALVKIAALMKEEPHDPSQDEDFNPDDYAGGNIDDAWYSGHNFGYDAGLWTAVSIAKETLEHTKEYRR